MLALEEQTNMNDCYFEKKDWRVCSQEVSRFVQASTLRLSRTVFVNPSNPHQKYRNP